MKKYTYQQYIEFVPRLTNDIWFLDTREVEAQQLPLIQLKYFELRRILVLHEGDFDNFKGQSSANTVDTLTWHFVDMKRNIEQETLFQQLHQFKKKEMIPYEQAIKDFI